MLAALTGTPGTGKSTIAEQLEQEGFRLLRVDELARRSGAITGYDRERKTWEVDLDRLAEVVPLERPMILVGHLSHLLPVDIAVVLRCHPDALRVRLTERGWPDSKVEENKEAEALGVIAQEASETTVTYQLDTISASPRETVKALRDILQGKVEEYKGKYIDWSEVILDWF